LAEASRVPEGAPGSRRRSRYVVLLLAALLALASVPLVAGVGRAEPVLATWYGPGFEGAITASGEPFDAQDYTAASLTFPFGTKLIVTYEGRSVVVRVNDRGPYTEADLDLSQAAAEYLGLTAVGIATVDVVQADPSTPTGPYAAPGTGGEASGDQYEGPPVEEAQSAEAQSAEPQSVEPQSAEPQQFAADEVQSGALYEEPQVLPAGEAQEEEAQEAADEAVADGDQYGTETLALVGEDQYTNEVDGEATVEAAETEAPAEPAAPAVPAAAPAPPAPPAPEVVVPQEIVVPPTPEEIVPGSTVERRLQLAGEPVPDTTEAAAPEAAPAPEEAAPEALAPAPEAAPEASEEVAPEPEEVPEEEVVAEAPRVVEAAAEEPESEGGKLPSETLTVLPDTGGVAEPAPVARTSGLGSSQALLTLPAAGLLLGLLVLRRVR
jgi:rare lipoprotein A